MLSVNRTLAGPNCSSAAMCLEVQADMRLLAAGQIRPNPKEILNIKTKKYALESFIPDS